MFANLVQRRILILSVIAVTLFLLFAVFFGFSSEDQKKTAPDLNDNQDVTEDSQVEEVKTTEDDGQWKESKSVPQKSVDQPRSTKKSTYGAKIIREILVQGNTRILSRAIVAYSGLKVNDRVNDDDLVLVMGRIFDSNHFDTVEVLLDKGVLKLIVKEKPIVNQVNILNISPQENLVIANRLQIKGRSTFDESLLQKDIATIEQGFRVSGQFNTNVRARVIELPNNRVDVEYIVDKGRLPLVRELEILGNKTISDRLLMSQLMIQRQSWVPGSKKSYLLPDLLNTSSERIMDYYAKFGYPYATVSSIVAEIDRLSDTFLLTFVLDEGDYYEFGEGRIVFEDNYDVFIMPDLANEILVKMHQDGEFYSSTKINMVSHEIRGIMHSFGYPDAEVQVVTRPDHKNKLINVDFKVTNLVRKYINRIHVRGNILSSNSLVLSRLFFSEGDLLDSAKIHNSVNALRSSGNFKNVALVMNNVDKNNVDVEIRITPLTHKLGNINIILDANTSSMTHKLRLTNNNIFGTGRSLFAEVNLPIGGSFRDADDNIDINSWLSKYTTIDSKQLSFNMAVGDDLTIPNVNMSNTLSYSITSDENILAYNTNYGTNDSNTKSIINIISRFNVKPDVFGAYAMHGHQVYVDMKRINSYFVNDDGTVKVHCSITIGESRAFMLASSSNKCRSIGGVPLNPDDFSPAVSRIIKDFWKNDDYKDLLAISDVFGNRPGLEKRVGIGYVLSFGKAFSHHKDPLVLNAKLDSSLIGIKSADNLIKFAKMELESTLSKKLSRALKFRASFNAGWIFSLDDHVVPFDMRYSLGGTGFPGFESQGISPRMPLKEFFSLKKNAQEYKFVGGNAFYRFKIGLHTPLFFPEEYGVDVSVNLNLGSAFRTDPGIVKAYKDVVVADSIYPRMSISVEVLWQGPFGNLTVGYGWSIKYQDNDERTNWIFNIGASI